MVDFGVAFGVAVATGFEILMLIFPLAVTSFESVIFADSVCVPLEYLVVSSDIEYGAPLFDPIWESSK